MKRLLIGVLGLATAAVIITKRRSSSGGDLEVKIEQLQEKFRSLDAVE
jgi:hypothetical protein